MLTGFLFLAEKLNLAQCAGIAAVIAAAFGGGRRAAARAFAGLTPRKPSRHANPFLSVAH
ncbi:hypothetical protein DPM35_00795 [Mesorhizobium atlanticum]|uniref:Uncharacterized protein n=1 Tax=Mesorhizobium atlanticum TaxID=2233532 RepID=A0A330H1T4_9HYPH|nr:hypothetical protein DPM35_00795 [Mesorhizobium atlanticum]